jgi:outer membrane protein OmpA-like peptidoglycan-associated protein/ABC-type nitrate/sulfonate/bicarbonate transport system substrate-binding protein
MAGQPKPLFYVAVGVVVVGLVAFAIFRSDLFAPEGEQEGQQQGKIDPDQLAITAEDATNVSAPTTVKEYTYIPSETLPPVEGTGDYKMENNTVRFALNVWAGWAPIIYANDGFAPNKVWTTPDGEEFRVELVLLDSPVEMLDAYSIGQVSIGWGTLDMLPLFMQRLVDREGNPRDNRVMPRIYQQIDWSNGGDGIVVRESIFKQGVRGLRGKTIALAESSPSHYFALNMLIAGGVQPSEVDFRFTPSAFEAAAAFNSDQSLSAAVSWAPDIYNLEKVSGNRILVDTTTANKLIADVWFARADFAMEHPGIIESLVRGIFDAMVELKTDAAKQKVARLMADDYKMPAAEAAGMLADAHSTNWAENYQFFLNQNNPTNFERVWNQAYYLYSRINKITHRKVPFDKVMDFSVIKKLGEEEKYSSQKDEYTVQFVPKVTSDVRAEEEILTNTVVIQFYSNSADPYKKDEDGNLYDPNVDLILEEIAKLAGTFGSARIIIEGHTDSTMKGRAPESLVKELSNQRANAVKQALINKFNLDPNQFNVEGMGWDRPADPDNPLDQAKNRRVEIKIYPAEAGA